MERDFSNKPLSKRAWELEDLWDQISSIWHPYEGPMQNLFRIASYIIPFVPGLGWSIFILEKIGAFFGYGLADLGAAIDRFAGWAPSTRLSITENEFVSRVAGQFNPRSSDDITSLMTADSFVGNFLSENQDKVLKVLQHAASKEEDEELQKFAWLGGLFKLIRLFPQALRGLWAGVKFLLLAFGFSKVGDIYASVSGTTKAPGALMLEETEDTSKDEDDEISSVNLEGLITDPTKLIRPLIG